MSDKDTTNDQAAFSANAMAAKAAGATPSAHPAAERTADEGIESTPRPDYPPSGAFDAEGHRPVVERTRKER